MERRHLTKDIEALLGDYIGQRLRENGFDPKGKKGSTLLDDLAHYDLAVGVALTWLQKDGGRDLTKEDTRWRGHPGSCMYPNRLEREAMILSSFAGTLLKSLPVEDVLSLYKCKPSTTYLPKHAQSPIVHPFTLSSHPFAMLTAYKAVEHAKRHTQMLQLWKSEKCVSGPPDGHSPSTPPSSLPSTPCSPSVMDDYLQEAAGHSDISAESVDDTSD